MQIEDLNKVEQRALDISKNKAISEQTKILKQLNVINTLSKSKDEMVTLSGVTLNKTQLDVAKSYYLNRQETINKATLDLEDNIFGPMISLYGSDMEELSDYYNADGAPLNPAFADAVKLPKMFKDEQELAVMASLGVVKEGDRVSYMKDNQIVEITLR
jgi:hypothetical protein